jgi:hypothetical protein
MEERVIPEESKDSAFFCLGGIEHLLITKTFKNDKVRVEAIKKHLNAYYERKGFGRIIS